MDIVGKLRDFFGKHIDLEQIENNVLRIYAPFFHEDGDMLSMYLQISDDNNMVIRDFGNTLMRVSYTFDIDSENKKVFYHQ